MGGYTGFFLHLPTNGYSNLSNKRHMSLIIYFGLCHACRSNWLGVVNYLFRFLPCVSLITKVSLNNFCQFHNWQKTHFCIVCQKKFLHSVAKSFCTMREKNGTLSHN